MDPRDMIMNQIRSDFESNRWTAFVLAGIVALGLAAWGQVLLTRSHPAPASARRASPDGPQISVLPDPFANQQ